MDAAFRFAENIVNTSYDNLPSEVVEITKKSILDTLGVMVGASGMGEEVGIRQIVDLVREGGGKEESSILGFGGKTVSWMAAFVNGAMAHILDYDDSSDSGGAHPTCETLPGALAIAERIGGVTGKEFITAVALGIDLATRLGNALNKNFINYGWLGPAIFGYFGNTAAACKLLKMSRDQIVNAFGLALDQTAGTLGSLSGQGSSFRAIRDGFSARGGVMSALLAEGGVTGNKDLLEGEYGLFNMYFKGDYDSNKLTVNLGKVFEGVNVSFKPWPSGRCTHTAITAVLDIINEHGLKPENINEITVFGGDFSRMIFESGSPDQRRRPQSNIDAKASLPFIIGAAAARGNITLDTFTSNGRNDQQVLEMTQKVLFKYDKRFNATGYEGVLVEIKTKDKSRYSKEVDFAYGHPENPISMEDLLVKFKDCISHAIRPIPKSTTERVIQIIDELEKTDDVCRLAQILSP